MAKARSSSSLMLNTFFPIVGRRGRDLRAAQTGIRRLRRGGFDGNGGKAYTYVDHTVRRGHRRRRRRRPARHARHGRAGAEDGLHHQGLPDPLAHRRRAGRHRRVARQYGAGQLAVAPLRHRQGLGLAGRHRRHGIHGAAGAGGRLRAGALRRALLAHRGRQDLPAPVRRPHDRVRRRPAGAAHLRCRRPHRPRHPAHALRPVAEATTRSSSSSISRST